MGKLKYTPQIGERICALLREGRTLPAIAREPGMVSHSTLFEWARGRPEINAVWLETRARRGPPYTPELGRRICALAAKGLGRGAIAELPGMPSEHTLKRWIAHNAVFHEAWLDACVARTHEWRRPRGGGARRRVAVYDTGTADRICHLLLEGCSMADVSRAPGMPNLATLWLWLRTYPAFRRKYGIACMLRDQIMGDAIGAQMDSVAMSGAHLGWNDKPAAAERLRMARLTLKRWGYWA